MWNILIALWGASMYSNIMGTALAAAVIGGAIAVCIWIACKVIWHEGHHQTDPNAWDTEREKNYYTCWYSILKPLRIIAIITTVICVLAPPQKVVDLATYSYIGNHVYELAVEQNPSVANIPDNVVRLVNEWINSKTRQLESDIKDNLTETIEKTQ